MKLEGEELKNNIPIVAYVFQALPLEKSLPKLLEKVLEQEKKAIIKFETAEHLEHFNTVLWTYHPKSFLPHGKDSCERPNQQPILLTTSKDFIKKPPNGATILLSLSLEETASFIQVTPSSFEKIIIVNTLPFSEKELQLLKNLSATQPQLHIQSKEGKWTKKVF